jgi:YidC/Oxa1 family membrane protein insertase
MSFIWHTFFYDPVYNALVFFINVFPDGDIGLAIIATVVLVKMILLPLSIKAAKTQRIMREIEPRLKALKEEFKDDRQRQAAEMMTIYKEAGMNPFASFLVILLQLPIFIALYFAVSSLVDVAEDGLISINFDPDILYTFVEVPAEATTLLLGVFDVASRSLPLAILAGATMFLQMKLTLPVLPPKEAGAKPDFKDDFMRNMQVQMKYVMPVVITVIAYLFPTAIISLYFAVSNITAIAQEYWVRRHR